VVRIPSHCAISTRGDIVYWICGQSSIGMALADHPYMIGAMKEITASDLKTILHSKRAHIYYLEHCRILVNGGRVEYLTEEGNRSQYWNIPIANTTTLMLGTGTSVTQSAMRELAKAGVMVGFCGGGGTPLFSANETDVEVAWFSPQSEYRPTEYLQKWVSFWFDDALRLAAAKQFQLARKDRIAAMWRKEAGSRESLFRYQEDELGGILDKVGNELENATDTTALLSIEARMTKLLFRMGARATGYGTFKREKNGSGTDAVNRYLDHGNYLAYGLAATATWVLGLPHSLAVLHGKTRRGALVFDVADLIKDAAVLPQAFLSAAAGDDEREFRSALIERFLQTEALDFMIETIQEVALNVSLMKS
jgi:CRISPR-associated protein Cas1